ncbi:MAG: hypothetical protein K5705_10325 [Oscillospiraceae bacterium]|nr:hypothetical protein [Oscillospiraceae bacterium]
MMRVWHESARRLRSCRRSAAAAGAARLISLILCILTVFLLKRMPPFSDTGSLRQDLWCIGVLAALLAGYTPLRFRTDRLIGELAGTLNANDLGFLACSNPLWLWCRAYALQILTALLQAASCIPPLLLTACTKGLWLLIPADGERLTELLTVLHTGILAVFAALLPLRVCAASAALPYCFLKSPHMPLHTVIRQAFRLTRGQSARILCTRLTVLPLLLLPYPAVRALPILLAAEQVRCARAQRHLQPRRSSRFSELELHAE